VARTQDPSRAMRRIRVCVSGLVQGVGFRPFVHRQATALGLTGWVMNSAEGVAIEVEGRPDGLARFLDALRRSPPPGALVTGVDTAEAAPLGDPGFVIRASEVGGARTAQIPVDLAPCAECLAELGDRGDRRWRYPFINCTACGPRFSLIGEMPYDRAATSMRHFEMCALCRAEYEDPSSRRFHAEPNACPACGPRLTLLDLNGQAVAVEDEALALAADALASGAIVAVKGVGGFHLLCDARSEAVVARLRERKQRPDKPFAVMFPSLQSLRAACRPTPDEEALLSGRERPIVLVRRSGGALASAIAPDNPLIGALLPYSPLHVLLMATLGFPVVATSGNLSDEPIAIADEDALARLVGVADHFLSHDRPIVRPVEDSVMRIVCGRPMMLRRSRGYAPGPIPVRGLPPGVAGLGGQLKTTIALTRGDGVALWPHIGDLDTVAARAVHARAVEDMSRLCDAPLRLLAVDQHPDYASRHAAERRFAPQIGVQHHLAHVAACLADNGAGQPALGVAWDGAGYGQDGTLWGGEFLQIGADGWRRVGCLRPFRLPGGAAAIREPRRAALGLLFAAFGEAALEMEDLAPVAGFGAAERRTLSAMLARGVNAPATSSVGRLFDAVAALTGLRQVASYEGQAACELEWAADGRDVGLAYSFPLAAAAAGEGFVLDWRPALQSILTDIRAGADAGAVSEALHNGLAAAIVAAAGRTGERRVALTGGCFQNRRLTEAAVAGLTSAGFEPLWHRQVPPNDGGLALGQAVWGAWTIARETPACA
jgi:hydrogenase maturation protein HypF